MVTRHTKTPGIPDIRDDNVAEVLRAIKTTLEVRERRSGDELDGFVRFRDLEDLNLADSSNGGGGGAGGGLPVGPLIPGGGFGNYNPNTDFTTPPAPTGFKVASSFTSFMLEWDGAPYQNHSRTEIWRAQADDLAQAILIGTAPGSVYDDPAGFDTEYWFWIRFVSIANVIGPWNSTSGTYGRTGRDIGKVIEHLSAELVNSALWTELSQRIGKIEVDDYIANRAINSKLEYLEDRDLFNTSRIFTLNSVTSTQATRLTVLESHGPSANRTFFTPERPDADAHGIVNNVPLIDGDVWYDTDESNRSYRWIATGWSEFYLASGNKVYHQPNDPATWNGTDYVDINGRLIIDGDLWYDEDDGNHPYRWEGEARVWKDFKSGDASAEVITLEQTKIGYATLNRDSSHGLGGSVFDHNGLIWNNVPAGDPAYTNSVQNWNAIHDDTGTDSELTWHVGLPFAHATKQVGITSGGSNATVQQNFTAMKQVDTGLLAQYTVKVDVNGFVAGFGLAQYASNDLNPTHKSQFIVNADVFGIGPAFPPNLWSAGFPYAKYAVVRMPGGPEGKEHVFQSKADGNSGNQPMWGFNGTTPQTTDPWWSDLVVRLPFITTTTSTQIDGVTYPPGVWISSANIFDAQIISAKIGSLEAGKITTGTLTASVGIKTGEIYGGVDPTKTVGSANFGQGFFLGDDAGTYKFFAGNVGTSYAMWDGATFSIKGHVHAATGQIGGTFMDATQLFSGGVSKGGGSGFYLENTGHWRVGDKPGARAEWDSAQKSFTIYGSSNQVLFSSGGINWSAIGVPPGTANSAITITPHGTLEGAGGGQVSAYWIGAVQTNLANAPGAILNQNVIISGSGGNITLTGGGGVVNGVVMPGFQITGTNVSTYIEGAAIKRAYIGLAAIGAAQIETGVITSAHIGTAQINTLLLEGEAVMVPRIVPYGPDQIVRRDSNAPPSPGGETILLGATYAPTSFVLNYTANYLLMLFISELELGDVSDGARFQMTAGLQRNGGALTTKTFLTSIINNQRRMAQTMAFGFQSVAAGTYFPWIKARQLSSAELGGNAANHKFGNQYLVVMAMKR